MKRLIICFDGTWNTADNGGSPTNVVRLARMIPPDDGMGTKQLVFYDQGVGTGNAVDRLVGGAFGQGLEAHVKLGYLFLAQNYEPKDEIYIFGFSRGAFTVRSLGGFIGACRGLLKRDKLYKLESGWNLYRTPPDMRSTFEQFNEIQENVHPNVRIKLMGVWDTVGSLGIPTDLFNAFNRNRYDFHDTALSGIVENAFQAMAIDEKRGPFPATLWGRPKKNITGQFVEQVWFAGVHADIGGGYESSELSDLTLRWMMARSMAQTGIVFDATRIAYFLPDSEPATAAFENSAARLAAIQRIEEKWKGTLHDSLGLYVASRVNPRLRVIGCRTPEEGTGPLSGVYRLSGSVSRVSFCEALHWSVIERVKNCRAAGIPVYDPPNLRVALDSLPVVALADENRPGTPRLRTE